MNEIMNLHKQAMDFAELAFLEHVRGNYPEAIRLFKEAYDLEKIAAEATPDDITAEPSRSILFRSAASLALNAKIYREAERMIALGLAGQPPAEIAQELRDLYEQVNFERHLELRGVALAPDEVQMSLGGPGIGFGMVQSDQFLKRIEIFELLAFRTAERKMGRVFREKGPVKKEIRSQFEAYLSIPRAASFAITIKMARPIGQAFLPGVDLSETVIDEIVDGIEYIANERIEALEQRIGDEAYFRNFMALTKDFAPDGEKIRVVGLSVVRRSGERRVALTRPREKIVPIKPEMPEGATLGAERVSVTGELSYADAKQQKIKITDQVTQIRYNVIVPKGLMADVVKPYWEDVVTVTGHLKKGTLSLIDIVRAE